MSETVISSNWKHYEYAIDPNTKYFRSDYSLKKMKNHNSILQFLALIKHSDRPI